MSTMDYCRDQAAPVGSNLYYSIVFHAPAHKRILNSLFAFQNELEQIVYNYTDPAIAQIKLQWWREEIARLFNQQSRHPITKELALFHDEHNLCLESFITYIDYQQSVINVNLIESYEDWLAILTNGPGLIWAMAAAACGFQNQNSIAATSQIGAQIGLFNSIKNVRRFSAKGQFLLPQKETKEYKVNLQNIIAGKLNENEHALFAHLIGRLEDDLHNSYREFPHCDRTSLLFCLIMTRLVAKTCTEIKKDGCQLIEIRTTLTPVRKLWIAWNTKRESKRLLKLNLRNPPS